MTKNFVFESIDESINSEALYLGKKSYIFDMDTGEILFKTKYRYEEFSHYCQEFAFYIGKYVYITDRYGNRLFKTELKIYNQFKKHEEELYKSSKSKNIEEKQDKILFKNNGKYDYIRKCLYDKKDYFIVKKNGLFALIDGLENTLVDFKYSSFYANYFEKIDKLLFVVQNPQTKLFGIKLKPIFQTIVENQYKLTCGSGNVVEDKSSFPQNFTNNCRLLSKIRLIYL